MEDNSADDGTEKESTDVFSIVKDMVSAAEKYADQRQGDRIRAIEYERGDMKDLLPDEGRSAQVSRDIRAHLKRVLPSMYRTILQGYELAEYLPKAEGDEEKAKQATDYLNSVIVPESNLRMHLYDALHDALLLRNGIVKWWWDERTTAKTSFHTGLDEGQLALLVSEDGVEVLEHTQRAELIEMEGQPQEVPVHDVRIKRLTTDASVKVSVVPHERFLIDPEAACFEDSVITGEKDELTRSDLISMGHDKDLVMSLTTHEEEEGEGRSPDDIEDAGADADPVNEKIDFYDIYVRVDMDGDGIAELHHMQFGGKIREDNLLFDEECDEVQMTDIAVMRQPHQWEGVSLFDDLEDIQRVKTVLLRQTLDNIYWQNNPQLAIDRSAVENPDAVMNPKFGQPILLKPGRTAREAIEVTQIPFVAKESFAMMEYLDNEARERTGVSDASGGLPPDALQNVTAKASALMEQQGIGQTELMVKTAAEGISKVFSGLLKLMVRHQDKPRTVRLRDEWVEIDPRHWNAEMDCSVNTGLGAGTRERDMQMMQLVMQVQEKILAGFGPNNPFVKADNFSAALNKFVESAGLKTPALYFTTPDPQEVQKQLEAQAKQPSPEQEKLQAQMQLEQAKMQSAAAKEKAQMDADLTVKQAEIQAHSQAQAEKLQSDAVLQRNQLAFDQQKWADEVRLREAEMMQRREDEILKLQAQKISAELKGQENAV